MFKNGSITKNSDLYGLCVDDIERAKALLEIKLADPLISPVQSGFEDGDKVTLDSGTVVESPVQDCGVWRNCQIRPTGTKVNPVIRQLYGQQ